MSIRPRPSPATAPFWAAARDRRLVLPRCVRCMEWAAPQEQPHECPCGGERRWTEASGRATVAAWTIVRKAAHPAMAADVPYTLLVVRLAEGPCLISSLPGEGRRLEVGAEVEAFFEDVTADVALVRFRPRAAESNGRTGGKHGLAR